MAAQRVPETPHEMNEWLEGTISVPELFLMPFKEIYEESLIVEYSPERCDSESGIDFCNQRPLRGHNDCCWITRTPPCRLMWRVFCCVKRKTKLLCSLWLSLRWQLYFNTKEGISNVTFYYCRFLFLTD